MSDEEDDDEDYRRKPWNHPAAGRRFGRLLIDSKQKDSDVQKGLVSVFCDCGDYRPYRPLHLAAIQNGRQTHCGGRLHKKTYALLHPDLKAVKIGCADHLEPRIKELQLASPPGLMVIGVHRDNVEAELHGMCAEHGTHGEWFVANDHVLGAIWEKLRPTSVPAMRLMMSIGRKAPVVCVACADTGHTSSTCAPFLNGVSVTRTRKPEPGSEIAFEWRGKRRQWSERL